MHIATNRKRRMKENMKKTFLLTLLLAGLFQMDAQNNIVKASVVFGNADVQYERALGKHFQNTEKFIFYKNCCGRCTPKPYAATAALRSFCF